MKNLNFITGLAEWMLIGAMGLCATLAFSHSNTFAWIQERLAPHSPGLVPYFSTILWGVLFILGFCLVILAHSPGKFAWVVALFSLPSLLSFNSINVLKIVGANWPVSTTLSFSGVLATGMAIMVCYVLLDNLGIYKKAHQVLSKSGADPEDLKAVSVRSHLWLLGLAVCALLTVMIIALAAQGLGAFFLPRLKELPWNFILAGLFCIVLLGGYLYWLGLRRHSG